MAYLIGIVRDAELSLLRKRPEIFDLENRKKITEIAFGDPRTRKLALELIAHRLVINAWLMPGRKHWFVVSGPPRPRDSAPRYKRGQIWHAGFADRESAGVWLIETLADGCRLITHSTSAKGPSASVGRCDCVAIEETAALYLALREKGLVATGPCAEDQSCHRYS
jgi:hypothetical protein